MPRSLLPVHRKPALRQARLGHVFPYRRGSAVTLKPKGFYGAAQVQSSACRPGLGRTLGTVMTMSTYLVLRSAGFTI